MIKLKALTHINQRQTVILSDQNMNSNYIYTQQFHYHMLSTRFVWFSVSRVFLNLPEVGFWLLY